MSYNSNKKVHKLFFQGLLFPRTFGLANLHLNSASYSFKKATGNAIPLGSCSLFVTFHVGFQTQIIFENLNYYCSNLSNLRNLQKQVKKAFCQQKLFWPFTVRINCSSDLKIFENSRSSASNFKSFSRLLEQFIQTVKGHNNFL